MYRQNDLVRIAKRQNNNRRNYLVINQLQGKHIPVLPSKALEMFESLAKTFHDEYKDESLLLIGFAETATAIGAAVAAEVGGLYIQTTREILSDVTYLFFSEEHSHATEQKLVKEDMDEVGSNVDRIVFVEDEVTTGKTVLNIIDVLEKTYGKKWRYSVVSLINGMEERHMEQYRMRGIPLHYLVKTDHSSYSEIANRYLENGAYEAAKCLESHKIEYIESFPRMDARRLVDAAAYRRACKMFWEDLRAEIKWEKFERILVLGTEEFMYPALYIAHQIEKTGKEVRFHATTRSPIAVSAEKGYPLYERWELKSLYDRNRTTYLYNVGRYDCVFVITDAVDKEGEESLFSALAERGNDTIVKVRWK